MRKSTAKFLFIYLVSNPVNALTESEFIQSLLSNNAFFEKEQINLSIKKIEMEGDRSNYEDWDWDIGGEIGRISKSKNKENNTSSYDYAKSTSQLVRKLSSDLNKKFLSNGSELSVYYDKSLPVKYEEMHDKDGYQGEKNTTEYLDNVKISWSLPLLKNKDGVVDQKTYDLAVLDYEDEILVLAEAQEDFIEEKLVIFLDWISYKTQIDVVVDRLKTSKDILKVLKKQINVDKTSILTMSRSINKTRRLLLDLQSKLKAEQKTLSVLLSSIDLGNNPPKIDWSTRVQFVQDLHQHLSDSIRDIKRIKIEQLKNKRSIKAYQNLELADFDFTISAIKDDNKGNYSTYSKSSEIEYEAKIEFTYPLTGDVSNQVYLQKYRLKNRQLALKYKDNFDEILSDAQKLTTQLKQGFKQLALYQQQINENSTNNIQVEVDEFLSGNGNIRFVINEQDEQQSLLLGQIEASIDYHKNRIKYDSLMDQLLINTH